MDLHPLVCTGVFLNILKHNGCTYLHQKVKVYKCMEYIKALIFMAFHEAHTVLQFYSVCRS